MNTVRKLVLKKGGKYVAIQTYGILGEIFLELNWNLYFLLMADK
jgi:hypothetical protein